MFNGWRSEPALSRLLLVSSRPVRRGYEVARPFHYFRRTPHLVPLPSFLIIASVITSKWEISS